MDCAEAKILPPILLAAAIGLEVVAGFLFPTWALPRLLATSLGLGVIAGSIALVALAMREMVRASTTFDARKTTTAIVATGVFRFTRNPTYLSMVLLVIGIGVMLNSPWAILVAIPLGSALDLAAIRPEEDYLEGKFGDEYRAYRDSVPRWFSLRRFFSALQA
jgi:protein-S-isoprenylcysteine O-methyltransferase Ste14